MRLSSLAAGSSRGHPGLDLTAADGRQTARSPPTSRRLLQAALLLIPCVPLNLLLWNHADFLLNSDQLFTASLVWDLLHHADAWSGFQQPHSPGFIPELAVHWLVQTLTGSWRIALAAFVLLQTVWLVAVTSGIVARLAKVTTETATLALVLLAMPLLIAAALGRADSISGGAFFPWLFFVQPSSHGGTFLLSLTAAALAFRAVQRPTVSGPLWIALLAFAANASDALFLVFFLVPVTAALAGVALTQTDARRPVIRVLAAAWAGAALGAFCVRNLDRQYMPPPTVVSAIQHSGGFLLDLGRHPVMALAIAGLLWGLAAVAWRQRPRAWIAGFWPLFATFSAAGSLLLTMMLYEDLGSYRYAYPMLWWPVMSAAAALARHGHSLAARVPAPAALVAVAVAAVALSGPASGWQAPRLLVWDSPLTACLEQQGLRAGLAEYWYARLTSAASDWRLQVDQIDQSGAARVWGNDRLWFTHDIHDPTRRPPYQFIIMNSLPPPQIAAVYGEPDRRAMCGSTTIWIYDRPGQLYRDLARASPALAELFAAAPGS